MRKTWLAAMLALGCAFGIAARAASYPAPTEADYEIKDFKFVSGESLPSLRIHYRFLGHPVLGSDGRTANAVLILHGTGGSSANFINGIFAGELFGPGQPLDAATHFIVIPDGIGHGGSSKPSDGMHARFPKYCYADMVAAQFWLLTRGLGVDHLLLVLGTSMGGMHTWLWGERYPAFMDALMPLASVPTQISGRNRVWRRAVIDSISNDPSWNAGDYAVQPPGLRVAVELLYFMGSNPVRRQAEMPTLARADEVLDRYVDEEMKVADANDLLYAVSASRDYDPGPGLEKIQARLLAVNSADDLINPPELGILEREIGRVPHGRAVIIPASDATYGHGTHTHAAVWKSYLVELLGP
jgi:homoserine O-acetyltransferase/O-succinyltransferase